MHGQVDGHLAPKPNLLLRRARFNAGLTMEQLAEKVGVSRQTIFALEAGAHPRPATAKSIADFFELRPTDLFPLGDLEPEPTEDAA